MKHLGKRAYIPRRHLLRLTPTSSSSMSVVAPHALSIAITLAYASSVSLRALSTATSTITHIRKSTWSSHAKQQLTRMPQSQAYHTRYTDCSQSYSQRIFHYTDLQRTKPTRENDPYEYQAGWNNRFSSEVIPGALPVAQNNPQDRGFGLYTEGITYSAFAAPRAHNYYTYMYRARPTAAHRKFEVIWFRTI